MFGGALELKGVRPIVAEAECGEGQFSIYEHSGLQAPDP